MNSLERVMATINRQPVDRTPIDCWLYQKQFLEKLEAEYGPREKFMEDVYKRQVFPEDIAEGVYFFASDLSNKSTGNFLNVDAGNAVSFTR